MAGKTKISDEDFLVAWQKFKSATQVANFFGFTERWAHNNRRRLEAKLKIKLEPPNSISVPNFGTDEEEDRQNNPNSNGQEYRIHSPILSHLLTYSSRKNIPRSTIYLVPVWAS
jgi:hypothetical protein